MKIIEAQSALLTDAEVLVHVRQVHQQALLNHQYVDEQGAKLRGLYNVVKDIETCFTSMGHTTRPFASRTRRPRSQSPSALQISHTTAGSSSKAAASSSSTAKSNKPTSGPPPQPLPSTGDERLPLELSLRLPLPHQAVPPVLPSGPRRLALDATAPFYPPSDRARFDAKNALYDPTPRLYAPRVPQGTSAKERVAFVEEAVAVMKAANANASAGAGAGRGRSERGAARERAKARSKEGRDPSEAGEHGLMKGDMLMICNLRPQSVEEVEVLIEDVEQRLGGRENLEMMVEGLRRVWEENGWALVEVRADNRGRADAGDVEEVMVEGGGQGDVDMEDADEE